MDSLLLSNQSINQSINKPAYRSNLLTYLIVRLYFRQREDGCF